jgi:hypothetical protein
MSYNPHADRALSFATITRALAIPTHTLHEWRGQGFLPTRRSGGSHYATVEDLHRALTRVREHPRTWSTQRVLAAWLLTPGTLPGLLGPYLARVDTPTATLTRDGGGNPAPPPKE